ncbi:hypothetical protein [Methylobacterium nonmethylotrophicum]|uniref:Uncharacterized protein n=1 Tax=Methylobacterium nonmethylotrophicum TaxID=1141884 RepID=A0A4Z0NU35_9HYPH|nr:hypothetical protein [Methylobacterium nonmethylotrophicum]TGE00289.1 hypothetical protein EU555_10400 [Methylobacterium nonmethylotrophicum]
MIASSVGSGTTRARPRTVRRWPTYNLFRRRAEPELVCAVPNDFPVPAFITGEAWSYAGSISAPSEAPPGFSAAVAEHGAETCGFHLFHQLPAVASVPDQGWRVAG